MNRMYILAAAMCVASLDCVAQGTPWSLDSCISYAIEHNIDVCSRAVDRYQGELAVTEAKDAFLPQVSAGASQSFNFGRGLTSENTYVSRNTSSTGWNVNLSLPLFQGLSAVRRLDYQKANLRTLLESEEAAKDNVELNVITQYLQVLYAGELYAVATEQVRISRIELERQRELFAAGKIPELDISQAESRLAQDELSEVNARNDRTLALIDLAQLLNLKDVDGFDIEPLPDTRMPLLSADDVYANAMSRNHDIRARRLAVAASEQNEKVAATGYLPRLSFNAGLGSSYYRINGVDNPSFGRQMRDNFNKSLGFTLSIPIFDAFSTRNSVRRARVQTLSARLQLEDASQRMFKIIQQAYYQAVAAEKKRAAGLVALDATRAAMLAMQEKYNYGRANATEYEQTKTAYVKAAAEAIQAKYETLLRIRILNFYNR
ncbi:MAG: TolC family protein [Muribaculaceae bacterium]|nr:TolC family protein [Muribaculaceae bacterium]